MAGFPGRTWLVVLGLTMAAFAAHADVRWDEATAGDFSDNGLAPTPVVMGTGSNVIIGNTGGVATGGDRDYFRFTVPDGSVLSQLVLLPNSGVSGGASFLAIQAGPQLTVSPSGAGAEALLGFVHYGLDQVGQNLLPAMAVQFSGALPAGTYSVWVQELGGFVDYGFDFVITAVPEPATSALAAAGLLAFALRRGRR